MQGQIKLDSEIKGKQESLRAERKVNFASRIRPITTKFTKEWSLVLTDITKAPVNRNGRK